MEKIHKKIHKQKEPYDRSIPQKGECDKKRKKLLKRKNFLQWGTKCVMIKCSYQNYMTNYQKIHCVGFVPTRKGLKKSGDWKYEGPL